MAGPSFIKMHGLGNDFVVIDGRKTPFQPTAAEARAIADRKTGVGCDQLIVIEPGRDGADVAMRIRNADGGEVEACGNGARCIGRLMMRERAATRVTIATAAGTIVTEDAGGGDVTVDMGPVRTGWRDIPLARAMDSLHLDIARGPLADGVGINVGNPHAVFFVPDAEAIDLAALGPALEHDPLFPERANIEVAQIQSRDRIRMRVWERGVGITRACGTGACATLAAAARRGLAERKAALLLDGGTLVIEWRDDNHVCMTGPAAISFAGVLGNAAPPS